MKPVLVTSLALLAGAFVFSSFAQSWTQVANLPGANWTSTASSADGTRLVAVIRYGGIFISTNSGVMWQTNTSFSPTHVTSSADGMDLAAVVGAYIDTSTNGGDSWTTGSLIGLDMSGIASSADGMKLVTVNPQANGGHIFTSTDGGLTWVTNVFAGKNWASVASSADGTKLIAAANGISLGSGGVYTSTNSGLTWVSNGVPAPFPDWMCVASSADGTKLAAGMGGNGGPVYTSTNSGSSWVSNAMPRQVWASLACSADGRRLVAVSSSYEDIYTSVDFGTTWVSNDAPKILWQSVASSADGNSLIAVANITGGPVNSGVYTLQNTPSPQMNIVPTNGNLNLSWTIPTTNFVVQSSADLAAWTDVTNEPVLNLTNLQDEVYLTPTGNVFFRLKSP